MYGGFCFYCILSFESDESIVILDYITKTHSVNLCNIHNPKMSIKKVAKTPLFLDHTDIASFTYQAVVYFNSPIISISTLSFFTPTITSLASFATMDFSSSSYAALAGSPSSVSSKADL